MSGLNCPTKNPLQRDGTSQYQRMMEALNPGYAPIHEFTLREWMLFAWHYAKNLNYYNTSDDTVVQSDWTNFVLTENEIKDFLKLRENENSEAATEPHLALFFSFLKLIQSPQGQLNQLTKKHLDFYYNRVLQLAKKPAVPDKVHLIFELAKKITSYKLDDDTLVDAGKDLSEKPKPLHYIINDEPVFYQAKTELFRSVYHEAGNSLRYAAQANSYNGNGAALNKENPAWHAFGFNEVPLKKDSPVKIKLPAAKPGFALASPIFLLKEGERTITVTLDLDLPASTDYSAFKDLGSQFIILLTGEKDWISPASFTIDTVPSPGKQQLKFAAVIDKAEKAIVGYNAAIHKENYNTSNPVIRVLLEADENKGYKAYHEFAKVILKKATINVAVTGMKDVVVENDDGKLDPAKPFLPFGPFPKKGSNFYIGSQEIFSKKWDSINLNFEWKSKPDDLGTHYFAYRDRFLTNNFTRSSYNLAKDTSGTILNNTGTVVTGDEYFKVDASYIKNGRWSDAEEKELFSNPISIGKGNTVALNPAFLNYGFKQLYTTAFDTGISYVQNYLMATPVMPKFNYQNFNPGFQVSGEATDRFTANTKDSFIKLSVVTDFFHTNYPVIYAAALTIPNAIIPKEPYTPTVASLTIDYTATIDNVFNIGDQNNEKKLTNYKNRDIQLFQEMPFGQGEQHRFLKEQQDFITDKNIYLAPSYTTEGEFYVGVKDLFTETILSVLFQVAEGSENPDSPIFDKNKNEEIQWFILCNNEWKFLNNDFIVSDDTNNFLRSGIIQFLIPEEATSGNTILPKEYHWLRAQLPAGIKFDSVCKLVDVLAQADVADFLNNNNELSHLKTSLKAGTIGKMVNKQAAIKSVTQPFNSFGGRPEETDQQFYIRVSERLRHKNRAVNIWDYERLVLENFPSVYKVKCLNHTSTDFELAPGSVRIIPIPDLRNKNIYDIYQPRVSRNMLTEIQDYLDELHGFHVDCKAENPNYEEVQFEFKVKFYEGYDPKTYVKILNDDLKKYLSPWAFEDFAEVRFGGALYKSHVIAFTEERTYVDFITDFKMYNLELGVKDNDAIVAGNSRAILTSAKEHLITAIQPPVCP